MAANRWLAEVYDPAVAAIPEALRDRLDPVEVFHEILEHRWFLSERAGRDIGGTAAREDYFARVLPRVPDDLTITAPHLPSQATALGGAPSRRSPVIGCDEAGTGDGALVSTGRDPIDCYHCGVVARVND